MKINHKSLFGWSIAFLTFAFIHSFLPALITFTLLLLLFIYSIAWLVVKMIKTRSIIGAYEPLFVVTITLLVAFTPVIMVSHYIHLAVYEGKYLSIINDIEKGVTKACNRDERCIIEETVPVSIAFPWDGFGDNWHGVCYDGADEIKTGSELEQYFSPNNIDMRDTSAGGMFGGDMTDASHMWGKWFLCGFT